MSICLNCGTDTVVERSKLDHDRFMCMIRAAFHHWPERHRFRPVGVNERQAIDYLRAWMFCQVNYCWFETTTFDPAETDNPAMGVLLEHDRTRPGHKFRDITGGVYTCRIPRSASFDSIGQKEFNELREAIEALIEHELGLSVSQLLKEHQAAA